MCIHAVVYKKMAIISYNSFSFCYHWVAYGLSYDVGYDTVLLYATLYRNVFGFRLISNDSCTC